MTLPLSFFRRSYPSANAVLLHGPRPVLVDPGFGADVPALLAWLRAQGQVPELLHLVVNTHFDCDHAGGNHALAERFGLPIAASAHDAGLVNARDPAACRAQWLHQPVEPYWVERPLQAGDVIGTGTVAWHVLETPGHTDGHVSLHAPEYGLLVTGDAAHADDVGWVDPHTPGALEEAQETLARLGSLKLVAAYSGHGGVTEDPAAAFAQAARRLAAWREAPERMAWHGVKRVFAYALMIQNGLSEGALMPYLLACPWFADYGARSFGLVPEAFAEALLAEMLRSGAARWAGRRLVATAFFQPPQAGWAQAPTDPVLWPH